MTDPTEQLRDKDQAVLRNISEGHDDVQKITSATTLENHQVTYSFKKLEELELITVEKPDKMVERVVEGQKRVFQAPKEANLTEKGESIVDSPAEGTDSRYADLSHDELIEKVHSLENRIEELEQSFTMFRSQVRENLK